MHFSFLDLQVDFVHSLNCYYRNLEAYFFMHGGRGWCLSRGGGELIQFFEKKLNYCQQMSNNFILVGMRERTIWYGDLSVLLL